MGKSAILSVCGAQLYSQRRPHFLLCLLAPQPVREIFFGFFTLNLELAHVHHAVSEEMLGHLRYAWWEENLQAIADGRPPRAHPVLQALTPDSAGEGLRLVEAYRSAYPELPDIDPLLTETSLNLIRHHAPESESRWRRGLHIVQHHRGGTAWLALKLLWSGFF